MLAIFVGTGVHKGNALRPYPSLNELYRSRKLQIHICFALPAPVAICRDSRIHFGIFRQDPHPPRSSLDRCRALLRQLCRSGRCQTPQPCAGPFRRLCEAACPSSPRGPFLWRDERDRKRNTPAIRMRGDESDGRVVSDYAIAGRQRVFIEAAARCSWAILSTLAPCSWFTTAISS